MDMNHKRLMHTRSINRARHTRVVIKPLGLSLFLLAVSFFNTAWGATAFVWSQYERPDINVYFSPDGKSTVQLTSGGTNVLAMLDRQGSETWICWIDKKTPHGDRLYYARLTSEGEILQIGRVPETSGGLYAPSIAIEPTGNRVWIVWAENHGRTEDLLISYLNIGDSPSSEWAPPIQMTADDKFSANMPHIDQAESGEARISWSHTGPDRLQRASAVVSTDFFETNRAIKLPRTEYENANGGFSRIKYITDSTSQSEDDLTWKSLTRNETAMMGAIISDSGVITRVFDKRKR